MGQVKPFAPSGWASFCLKSKGWSCLVFCFDSSLSSLHCWFANNISSAVLSSLLSPLSPPHPSPLFLLLHSLNSTACRFPSRQISNSGSFELSQRACFPGAKLVSPLADDDRLPCAKQSQWLLSVAPRFLMLPHPRLFAWQNTRSTHSLSF